VRNGHPLLVPLECAPDVGELALGREVVVVTERLPRFEEVAVEAMELHEDRDVGEREESGTAHASIVASQVHLVSGGRGRAAGPAPSPP